MKNITFICTFLCLCVSVFAHDFTATFNNGAANKTIYYRVTSAEAATVAVSYRGDSVTHYAREYADSIKIPATVTAPASATAPAIPGVIYKVTSVDAGAFLDNTTLTRVYLPNSVTFIDSMAFAGCTILNKCVLPPNINFIGARAFEGCSGLLEIELPENISKISNSTFKNCRSLTSIIIPDMVNLIGDYAFTNCTSLQSINLSGAVGKYAFYNCIALEEINISRFVTKVGSFAFLGCLNLNSINVEENNPILMSEDGVLYTRLQDTLLIYPPQKLGTEFTTPSSVKTVADYSFSYSLFLKKINFNNSLTKIGTAAFYNSTGLSTVNISDLVSYIGEGAFYNCRNLDTIKITAETPPEIQNFTFYNVPSNVSILVKCDFVDSYKTSQWGEYFSNIKGYDCTTDIPDVEYRQGENIYPNPVKDELFISSENKIERVDVYSLSGSLLISENNFTNSISMTSIPQGIYFVKIITDKAVITKKIIKN